MILLSFSKKHHLLKQIVLSADHTLVAQAVICLCMWQLDLAPLAVDDHLGIYVRYSAGKEPQGIEYASKCWSIQEPSALQLI